MILLTDDDFHQLRRAAPVVAAAAGMEQRRQAAVRRFWLWLLGGSFVGAALAWLIIARGEAGFGIVLGVASFVGGAVLAVRTIGAARGEIKLPVWRALAAIGGFTYADDDFEPPVFAAARAPLFGALVANQRFYDMLSGTEAEGRRWWTYGIWISHRATGSSDTRFSGRVYAFDRRGKGGGPIVALSERGLLKLAPAGGLARVRMESDPAFEEAFDVFAANPADAIRLLDADARRTLCDLRGQGRVLVYAGPGEMLVALGADDPLDTGSMFRAIDADARVRRIFDGAKADLATLHRLVDMLG